MIITRQGCELPKTLVRECRKARDQLTMAPLATTTVPRPLRFPAYVEDAEKLVVPQYWAKDAFPNAAFKDMRSSGKTMDCEFEGQLRPELEQPQAVDATLQKLRTTGGAVLSLAVGHGKTCCGLYIACKLRAKTLILVHKRFLADQWAERIAHFVPSASVSFIQGAECDTSGDFVIAMIQTLLSRDYSHRIFDPFSLLIFDEAHHVAAKVFSQIMFSLNLPYTLGLTATPTRKDGLERLIHYFLGPVSYTKSLSCDQNVHVGVYKYSCEMYADTPPTNVRGDVDYTKILTMLAGNAHRTAWIVELIEKQLLHKDVLVLSHRRAHCEALVKLLQNKGLDAALYIGGIKTIPTARILVSSYAYVSEGFDEPRLEALVLTTPASDVSQTVGRILRGNAPNRSPCIIDIVDTWGVCFAQAAKRRKQYLASGFIITQKWS